MIEISVFANAQETENGILKQFRTLDKLYSAFASTQKQINTKIKKHVPYFTRGKCETGKREDADILESNLVIIDGDCSADGSPLLYPLSEVDKACESLGWNYILYPSFSYEEGKQNKFRIVIHTEAYGKRQLEGLVSHCLKELRGKGISIKNGSEMKAWSQAWFIPYQVGKKVSLYGHFTGEAINVQTITSEDEAPQEETSKDSGETGAAEESGKSLADMFSEIRDGIAIHPNLINISYQLAKDGVSQAIIKAMLTSAMDGSSAAGTERWQARYDDLDRVIEGAFTRIESEDDDLGDYEAEDKIRSFDDVPWPTGNMGKLCDSISKSQKMVNPETAVCTAIGITSALFGRAFNFVMSEGKGYAGLNTYQLLVAGSGVGKSDIEGYAKWLFNHLEIPDYNTHGDFTGPSSLSKTLQDHPSVLSVATEAGIGMTTKAGDQAGLRAYKLNLYGQSGYGGISDTKRYSNDDNNVVRIHQPSYSQIGESTPDSLLDALRDTNSLNDGLLPRNMLYVIPDGRRKQRNFDHFKSVDSAVEANMLSVIPIAEKANKQSILTILPYEITFADDKMRKEYIELNDRWDNEYESQSERTMNSRLHLKLAKLACLASLLNASVDDIEALVESRSLLYIDWESWEWAKKMCQYQISIQQYYIEGINRGGELDSAALDVINSIKSLYRGDCSNKRAQQMFNSSPGYAEAIKRRLIQKGAVKKATVNMASLRKLDGAGKGYVLASSFERMLEYMQKAKYIKVVNVKLGGGRAKKVDYIQLLSAADELGE